MSQTSSNGRFPQKCEKVLYSHLLRNGFPKRKSLRREGPRREGLLLKPAEKVIFGSQGGPRRQGHKGKSRKVLVVKVRKEGPRRQKGLGQPLG
eukprot:2782665-Pleurochrysis_carterae.AAC.1